MRDQWDRDLLRVTYEPQQLSVDEMIEIIHNEGFEAHILDVEDRASPNEE